MWWLFDCFKILVMLFIIFGLVWFMLAMVGVGT